MLAPKTSDKPSKFILPDLVGHCTFALHDNVHREPVSRASEAWLLADTSFSPQKRARFLRLLAGELTASCYPHADAEHLRVCSDFMNFLFNLDDWSDEFDEHSTCGLGETVMNVLRNPETFETDKVVGAKTRSIWTRMKRTAGPGCQYRFVHTFDLFFTAVTQQARDRANGVVPDLESYITLRRDTSGCKPCFALTEYAANIDLPDEVIYHPLVQSLEQATNDLVTWSNDLFSYNVEQSRGDTHNMIVVLMQQRGITLQEAVDVVGNFCKTSIDTFAADAATLASISAEMWGPEVAADVQTYVQGLQDWIVGSLHWSFMTERYLGTEGPAVKKHRVVTLLPPAEPDVVGDDSSAETDSDDSTVDEDDMHYAPHDVHDSPHKRSTTTNIFLSTLFLIAPVLIAIPHIISSF